MTDDKQPDELDEVFRRMRDEFGNRRPPDPLTQIPPPPPAPRDALQPALPPRIAPNADPPGLPPLLTRLALPTGHVWVTWVLLAINVLMFGLTHLLAILPGCTSNFPPALRYNCALVILGWKDNALIYERGQYWRLLTATFLHGGLVHLGLNMLALYVLGPQAERVYRSGKFLLLYLTAGLTGSVASYAFTPAPSVGASGAIFGIFGALGIFFYTARDLLGEAGREQLRSMVVLVGINIAFGLVAGGAIDNFAHMGGLAGGLIAGWLLVPRFTVVRDFFRPRIEREDRLVGVLGIIVFLLAVLGAALLIPPPLR